MSDFSVILGNLFSMFQNWNIDIPLFGQTFHINFFMWFVVGPFLVSIVCLFLRALFSLGD